MFKNLVFLLLLFPTLNLFSTNKNEEIFKLNSKKFPLNIFENWKINKLDSAHFANKSYSDKNWDNCINSGHLPNDFNGKAWFRFTFYCDSNLINKPLSISVNHFGASEIYLDGLKLIKYGTVSDSLNSIYEYPQGVPFIFFIKDTGIHVFAIKYVNFNSIKNFKTYNNDFNGFDFTIENANSGINIKLDNSIAITFFSIMLSSIFMIFGLLHLFLFLYDTKAISNIYLSLFMFSIATLFFFLFLSFNSNTPNLLIVSRFMLNSILCFSFIMLSEFLNTLFKTKNKIRFYIVLISAVISIILNLLGINLYKIISILLFLFVSFESVFIIFSAIKNKVKGVKIIGFGTLFTLSYFIFLIILIIVNNDNLEFNDSTFLGTIVLIYGALAIVSIPFSITLYMGWNFANINKNLALQIKQTELLSQKNIEQEQEKVKLISSQNEQLEIKVSERTKELSLEKKKSDDLLLNILPLDIAEELKIKGESNAKLYDNVSVLFTDFVDFTKVGEKLSPKSLVEELNFYFTAFDHIIIKHGLEKIKTIGDAYMAVCGMPNEDNKHALKTINASIEIIEFVNQQKEKKGQFDIRIGINSGPVVAGIIGVKKFAYDIWGDTVNTAARMEQNSEAGKINISGSTYELVKDHFKCSYRGKINAKNKGDIDMFF